MMLFGLLSVSGFGEDPLIVPLENGLAKGRAQ